MPLSRYRWGFLVLGIVLALATGCKKTAKKEARRRTASRSRAVPNAGGGGEGKGASGVIPAGWKSATPSLASAF